MAFTFDWTWPIHGFGAGDEDSALESFVEMLNSFAEWKAAFSVKLPEGTAGTYIYNGKVKYDRNSTPNLIGEYTSDYGTDGTKTYTFPLATMTAIKDDYHTPSGYIIDIRDDYQNGGYGSYMIFAENSPFTEAILYRGHGNFLCKRRIPETYNSDLLAYVYSDFDSDNEYRLFWDREKGTYAKPVPYVLNSTWLGQGQLSWSTESTDDIIRLMPSTRAPSFDCQPDPDGRWADTLGYKFMSSSHVRYYGFLISNEKQWKWHVSYADYFMLSYNTIPMSYNDKCRIMMLLYHPYMKDSELKNYINFSIYNNNGWRVRDIRDDEWAAGNQPLILDFNSGYTLETGTWLEGLEANIYVFPDKSHYVIGGIYSGGTIYGHRYLPSTSSTGFIVTRFSAQKILSSFTFTFHAGHGMGDEKCCCCKCEITPEEEDTELYEVHINFTSESQLNSTTYIQQKDVKNEWDGNVLKLWLKDGDTITVLNVPVGTEYNIEVIQPEEYDECDKREYNIEPSSGTVGDYDPETGEGETKVEVNIQTGETVQQYLDRLRQRGYEQLAENLKLENVEFTLQDERIKLGDLVTVDLPEFDFKAVVRVTGVKLKSQGNQTIRTISVGTPLKILRRSKI